MLRFVPTNSIVTILFAHPHHTSNPTLTIRFDVDVPTHAAASMPAKVNLTALLAEVRRFG
jgi:hypothetical protein